jgi:hypothetical protein
MAEDQELDRYKRALGVAMDALHFYAQSESYHAIAIICDPPCGEFARDFGWDLAADYERKMPGRTARIAMKTLNRVYGDLSFYTRN